MNEFNATTGGRYLYADDVLNLQDLALAFGHIFDECGNFIVSGCKVSDNAISSGYVYLNGKFRYFSGRTGITEWPQYLYENNDVHQVNYASGEKKAGYNIYGVSAGSSVPSEPDKITNNAPVSIEITRDGGPLMKDVFFGSYAIIHDARSVTQELNGSLRITGDLDITGDVRSNNRRYQITGQNSVFNAFFDDGKLSLSTEYENGGKRYSLSMENGIGFASYINKALVSKTEEGGMVLPGYVKASFGVLGNIGISENGIYNRKAGTNSASLDINMVGLNGEAEYFRDTRIGDGKGTQIVSVNGSSKSVKIFGLTTIESGSANEGIVFLLNNTKDNADLQKSIVWKDSAKETMGIMGFTESTDMTFRITNNLAGVYVYGATNSFVDLGPSIKENGTLLSDKYASKTSLDGYAQKSAFLSDMAQSEDGKKAIRDNIGAAGKNEVQGKLKDSGWKSVTGTLFARQIGDVVSIQGRVTITASNTTLFTLPDEIDPPTKSVSTTIFIGSGVGAFMSIEGDSRECNVVHAGESKGQTRDFSMTYIV